MTGRPTARRPAVTGGSFPYDALAHAAGKHGHLIEVESVDPGVARLLRVEAADVGLGVDADGFEADRAAEGVVSLGDGIGRGLGLQHAA